MSSSSSFLVDLNSNPIWRGPLIFSVGVLVAFHLYVSIEVLGLLIVLGLGVTLTVVDALRIFQSEGSRLRLELRKFLERFSIDDIMHFFYNPDEGVFPCIIGTFVGGFGMYGLPLTPNQRVQLYQCCLLPGEDAKTIFMTPGGYLNYLPEHWKEALRGDATTKPAVITQNPKERFPVPVNDALSVPNHTKLNGVREGKASPPADKNTGSDCGGNTDGEADSSSGSSGLSNDCDKKVSTKDYALLTTHKNTELQPNLVDVCGKIVKELIESGLKDSFDTIPQNKLQSIGLMTLLALFAQLKLNGTARRMAMNMVHGMTSVGLTMVATVALSLLAIKKCNSMPSNDIGSRGLNCFSLATVSNSLKERITRLSFTAKGRAFVVFLIILVLKQSRLRK
mmetsp:Transcript_30910/g.47386  ORF Transcript_30910/g.47386 Transcript_30910/m.47386 type:complete len:394 (-) Transcript_30910:1995-3176(-)